MTKEEFKKLRLSADLSVKGLARLMKVHERTIRRWEYGERKVPEPVALIMVNLEKFK